MSFMIYNQSKMDAILCRQIIVVWIANG